MMQTWTRKTNYATLCVFLLIGVNYNVNACAQSPFDFLMPSRSAGPESDRDTAAAKQSLKDPRTRKKFIEDCIYIMATMLPNGCKKNLPILDKSGCKNFLVEGKKDAKRKCERVANGETLSF